MRSGFDPLEDKTGQLHSPRDLDLLVLFTRPCSRPRYAAGSGPSRRVYPDHGGFYRTEPNEIESRGHVPVIPPKLLMLTLESLARLRPLGRTRGRHRLSLHRDKSKAQQRGVVQLQGGIRS